MEHDYVLKPCAGSNGWYEIIKPVAFPGEWYMENPSKNVYTGPFQRQSKTYLLSIGSGKVQ